MEERGPSHSAPYGQACMSCFKSKCKCVLRPDGDACERCHRLGKECHPSDAIRRRAADKKQDSDARIARLEGRLDGLVSLLQSRKALDGDTAVQPQQNSHAELRQPSITMRSLETGGNDDTGTAGPTWTANSPEPMAISPGYNSHFTRPTTTTLEPSASSASAYLDVFRSRMLLHFPFVHLPAHLTAQELRSDRPFLFRAIVCVASSSAPEKRARASELKRVLYETAFLQQQEEHENQSDSMDVMMDLLLGLLTFVAWGWDHVLSRCSLSRLMMMAMSLVGEMRLDKPAPQDLRTMGLFTPEFEGWYDDTSGDVAMQLLLERQRAVLGCFVLSSVTSAYFAQVDGLRWTPRMEEAIVAISGNKECPTDAALALQVRLQLLVMKAVQVRDQNQQVDQAQTEGIADSAVKAIKALLEQLQELRVSISSGLHQYRDGFLAHTHYVELCIIQTVLSTNSVVPPMPDTGNSCGHPSPDRLSCFWQSLLAINACTSSLLTLSPSDFLGISFLQWAQLSRCVVVLSHLTALEDPVSDVAAVRALVDLPILLDAITKKMELAAAEADKQDPDDVFTQLACGMRIFRSGIQGGSRAELEHRGAGQVAAQNAALKKTMFWVDQLF